MFKLELGNGVIMVCDNLKKLLHELVFEADMLKTDLPENTLSMFTIFGVAVIKFPLRMDTIANDLETLIHTVHEEWC